MKKSAFLLLSSLGAFLRVAQAAPVGMAAHVTGQVTAIQGTKKTPLRTLGRLEAGTTLVAGPNSNAVIVLFGNGARFQLGAGARATVSETGVSGAAKLDELSGPSAGAVKLLGDARVGAIMARPANSYQRLWSDAAPYFETKTPYFKWSPVPNAERYTFTLFDNTDNVVYSVTTEQTGFEYPATALPLMEKQPYVWKLSAFSATGKRDLNGGRWGIVTILTPADAQTLGELVSGQKEACKTAKNSTPYLVLAETYRSYGVLNGALETLDDLKVRFAPGSDASRDADDAKSELLGSLSPFARVLAGVPSKTDAF